jgi:hypothetical protein
MPLESVLLGVGSSDPRRRPPSRFGSFSIFTTAVSVRAIRSCLGADITSTTLTRSPQLAAARCFCGPRHCAPAVRGSRSSSCPSHSALASEASEMTLQARTKYMQNTMTTSPASSRVMLSATLAHIVVSRVPRCCWRECTRMHEKHNLKVGLPQAKVFSFVAQR